MTEKVDTDARHAVSASCQGEKCRICGAPATHKVEETLMLDVDFHLLDPLPTPVPRRHPFSAYICCADFARLMGPAVFCPPEAKER